jgi:hypothetical protein
MSCGGESGSGALRCPLPMIPPTTPHSSPSPVWCSRPDRGPRTKRTQFSAAVVVYQTRNLFAWGQMWPVLTYLASAHADKCHRMHMWAEGKGYGKVQYPRWCRVTGLRGGQGNGNIYTCIDFHSILWTVLNNYCVNGHPTRLPFIKTASVV